MFRFCRYQNDNFQILVLLFRSRGVFNTLSMLKKTYDIDRIHVVLFLRETYHLSFLLHLQRIIHIAIIPKIKPVNADTVTERVMVRTANRNNTCKKNLIQHNSYNASTSWWDKFMNWCQFWIHTPSPGFVYYISDLYLFV